jgi:tetratricopeptide (TPR) repeat protein
MFHCLGSKSGVMGEYIKGEFSMNSRFFKHAVPVLGLAFLSFLVLGCASTPTAEESRAQAEAIRAEAAPLIGKDNDKAMALLNKAIRIDPTYARAYSNRGLVYADRKEYYSAIEQYTKAIEVDPNYAAAYSNRGSAYSNRKDYDHALADYAQAIKLDPNMWHPYYGRSFVYSDREEYARALADCEQAAKLEPNDKDIADRLVFLRAMTQFANYHGEDEFSTTFNNLSNPYAFEKKDGYYLTHVIPTAWIDEKTYRAYSISVGIFTGDQKSPYFYIDIGDYKPSDISKNTLMGTDFGQVLILQPIDVVTDMLGNNYPKFKLVYILTKSGVYI